MQQGPFDGLIDAYFALHSPLVALGGAGLGALIARIAGRSMGVGGAIGAVVGGCAIGAYMIGGIIRDNLYRLREGTPRDW
jgi:hypothetical protein